MHCGVLSSAGSAGSAVVIGSAVFANAVCVSICSNLWNRFCRTTDTTFWKGKQIFGCGAGYHSPERHSPLYGSYLNNRLGIDPSIK